MNDKPLAGQCALVTGASRGIGRAIALDLARHGADVVVNCAPPSPAYETTYEEALAVKAEIESLQGARAIVVQADVTDMAQAGTLIEATLKEFGRLDILVNNAALHIGGRLHKIAHDDWLACFSSCVYSAYNTCRLALPQMIERQYGRIINIGSNVGIAGFPGDTAYGAGKAAVMGLTKSLALEVADKGITANVVAPGFVKTVMTDEVSEHVREDIMSRIPMKRIGDPAEIAAAVTFLATGGSYITGQVIRVNGGKD